MLTRWEKKNLEKLLTSQYRDITRTQRSGENGKRTEFRFTCPFCKGGRNQERSFDFNIDEGVARCWRQKCGWSGRATQFLSATMGVTREEADLLIKGQNVVQDEILLELMELESKDREKWAEDSSMKKKRIDAHIESEEVEDSDIYDRVVDWIENVRGYDFERFISQHEILVPRQSGAWENRVQFVVRTNDDVAYLMYSMDPKSPNKTLNPSGRLLSSMLYNYNEAKNHKKIVFVCEGIFDAARMKDRGLGAVASFGTNLSHYQAMLLSDCEATEICLCDDDGVEESKIEKKLELLDSVLGPDKKITRMTVDIPDADPDSISLSQLKDMVRRRKVYRRDRRDDKALDYWLDL